MRERTGFWVLRSSEGVEKEENLLKVLQVSVQDTLAKELREYLSQVPSVVRENEEISRTEGL